MKKTMPGHSLASSLPLPPLMDIDFDALRVDAKGSDGFVYALTIDEAVSGVDAAWIFLCNAFELDWRVPPVEHEMMIPDIPIDPELLAMSQPAIPEANNAQFHGQRRVYSVDDADVIALAASASGGPLLCTAIEDIVSLLNMSMAEA